MESVDSDNIEVSDAVVAPLTKSKSRKASQSTLSKKSVSLDIETPIIETPIIETPSVDISSLIRDAISISDDKGCVLLLYGENSNAVLDSLLVDPRLDLDMDYEPSDKKKVSVFRNVENNSMYIHIEIVKIRRAKGVLVLTSLVEDYADMAGHYEFIDMKQEC